MAEPGQYQILRIETYKRLDERLVSHVKGVTRPPTARPVDPDIASVHPEQPPLGPIVELGGEGAGAARELIERTRPTGRGRKPGEAIEILMAGPPSYGSADQWSDVRELEWARESVAWTQRIIGPDSLIVTAALHRDEKSPHVQMLVVPVHEGRLGWTAVEERRGRPPRARTVSPGRGRSTRVFRMTTTPALGAVSGSRGVRSGAKQRTRRSTARRLPAPSSSDAVSNGSMSGASLSAALREAAAAEHDARIDALLAEVADEKAAQAAESERKAVEAAKAAELRETLAGARVAFERDRASMLAAAARVVSEQITEQASELVVLRQEADKLDRRLVKARIARAEVDQHVQVKRRELPELDEKARVAFDAESTAALERDRLDREAGEAEAARDRARHERDEAERDAGQARNFDAAAFAGLVLRVADRLRVVLPERLADALGRVVERRSAAPVFQLARLLIREERSRSATEGRDEPHKRRKRGRGKGGGLGFPNGLLVRPWGRVSVPCRRP